MLNLSPSTSPLAVASIGLAILGCFCPPAAFAALVLGIVALVQMKKNPGIEGRGYAIAGLVFSGVYVPLFGGIMYFAISQGQAETRQKECRDALVDIALAEQAFREKHGVYTEEVRELTRFLPYSEDWRYAYVLSAAVEWDRNAVLGVHPDALTKEQVLLELDRPLAGDVTPGTDGERFTAVCVGNIDGDEQVDVWSVSSHNREDPNGRTISAWDPYNDWNDKEEKQRGRLNDK